MSLFKVKPGKKVWTVYTGTYGESNICASFHENEHINAEREARRWAHQRNNKGAR